MSNYYELNNGEVVHISDIVKAVNYLNSVEDLIEGSPIPQSSWGNIPAVLKGIKKGYALDAEYIVNNIKCEISIDKYTNTTISKEIKHRTNVDIDRIVKFVTKIVKFINKVSWKDSGNEQHMNRGRPIVKRVWGSMYNRCASIKDVETGKYFEIKHKKHSRHARDEIDRIYSNWVRKNNKVILDQELKELDKELVQIKTGRKLLQFEDDSLEDQQTIFADLVNIYPRVIGQDLGSTVYHMFATPVRGFAMLRTFPIRIIVSLAIHTVLYATDKVLIELLCLHPLIAPYRLVLVDLAEKIRMLSVVFNVILTLVNSKAKSLTDRIVLVLECLLTLYTGMRTNIAIIGHEKLFIDKYNLTSPILIFFTKLVISFIYQVFAEIFKMISDYIINLMSD